MQASGPFSNGLRTADRRSRNPGCGALEPAIERQEGFAVTSRCEVQRVGEVHPRFRGVERHGRTLRRFEAHAREPAKRPKGSNDFSSVKAVGGT